MQSPQCRVGQPAYRPTSLDFINRPNPVEPHTDPHKHPLHADQSQLRLLHDTNNVSAVSEPPRKRRKSHDGPSHSHDMGRPTLPAVRQHGEKRLRIPPTLSGLHQPPPDAGILPSISVDGLRSVELPERSAGAAQPAEQARDPLLKPNEPQQTSQNDADEPAVQDGPTDTTQGPATSRRGKARKNRKWTDHETECLLKGVEKHGIGSWTKILKDPKFFFDERRSPLDLKDRFRVCCPDKYKTTRKPKLKQAAGSDRSDEMGDVQTDRSKRTRTTHRKTEAEIEGLGIDPAFAKSVRRKRTGYSEAEDKALLAGFHKHGNKWAKIQQDEALGLESRTAMDLRDRMRNRWPEEYANAGLKLHADVTPHGMAIAGRRDRAKKDSAQTQPALPNAEASKDVASSAAAEIRAEKATRTKRPDERTNEESHVPTLHQPAKKTTTAPAPFLTQADDVFWGPPLLDADEERITLDRRILDWPLESISSTNRPAAGMLGSVDSISTLNLPRPNALASGPPFAAPSGSGATAATLPSLATVTAGSMPFDFGEQLELPSLLEGFGGMDGASEGGEGRGGMGGMGMPSLDEILG